MTLGYECSVALLSLVQVKTNEFGSMLIRSSAFLSPLLDAVLNQCSEVSSDIPTLISKVFKVLLDICNHLL